MTVNPLVHCGACDACRRGRENLCPHRQIISMPPREGAFAEYVAMPPANLVEIPEGVTTAKAALAEPLACGWHAVRLGTERLDRPLGEARCLVFGGGAIGLGAALVLAARGAGEIWLAEPHAGRRAIAEAAGPFRAVDPGAGGACPRASTSSSTVSASRPPAPPPPPPSARAGRSCMWASAPAQAGSTSAA